VPPISPHMMTVCCSQRGLSLGFRTQWLVPTYWPRCLAKSRTAIELDVAQVAPFHGTSAPPEDRPLGSRR